MNKHQIEQLAEMQNVYVIVKGGEVYWCCDNYDWAKQVRDNLYSRGEGVYSIWKCMPNMTIQYPLDYISILREKIEKTENILKDNECR